MNANKITAICTAILALIASGVALYNIREADLARFEKHEAQEGHPRLVEQSKMTRELLEQRIGNIEDTMKSMVAEMKEIKSEVKEIRACMHRIEKEVK